MTVSHLPSIYLFWGVSHCFQHFTGHSTTESFVGRGTVCTVGKGSDCKLPIGKPQLVKVLTVNCRLVSHYQLSHLRSGV